MEDKNDTAKKPAASPESKKQSEDLGGGHGTKKRNNDNALSGLMTTYGKKDKFVHWSDHQGVKGSSTGFLIGSSQKPASLVIIGPGPSYNEMSNMLVEGDVHNLESTELKKSNKFVEQLRAEQEAFKVVFARRRQRIRGMEDEDDD